jgi:predicted nucleotidyltransferase
MTTLEHAEHRLRQTAILDAAVAVCAAEPSVIGVFATGSYARGDNDAFSDLDIGVYLEDEARGSAQTVHERIAQIAPTLSVLYLYDQDGLYLFDNGVRLDITYKPRSAIRTEGIANVRILHDPHAILGSELGADHAHADPIHPQYFKMGDPSYPRWFLWMFRQIYAWTKRAAQEDRRSFDKLLDAGNSLQIVRTSLLQMRRWTLGSMDYFGVADPQTATDLTQTYGALDPPNVLVSVRRLLAIYERICPAYCARAGTEYPADAVISLRRVLDEFDTLT